MKKMLMVIIVAVLFLNDCYIIKTVHDFSKSEDRMVAWLSAGIGGEAEVIDSIYGREFVAIYTVEDNYTISRTVKWK